MSDASELEKKFTNKLLTDQFIKDLGSKAVVEHHNLEGDEKDYTNQLREVLADVAADLQKGKIVSPGMDYLGSFSVHVYASELMRSFAFVGLNNPHKTTHPVADAAMRKLNEDVTEHFTGKRKRLRSGF